VFGEGARRVRVMFIGEQPGNEEDLTGRPFVGPAGRLLDDALEAAGIDPGARGETLAVADFVGLANLLVKRPTADTSDRR